MSNKLVAKFSSPKYEYYSADPNPTLTLELTKAELDEFIALHDLAPPFFGEGLDFHYLWYEPMRKFLLSKQVDSSVSEMLKED